MAKDVMTGVHFMNGDIACAEGALAAGCRFYAGYPITPSSEVAERMSVRLPQVGGVYIQMEDEIASMAAIIGAAWGGARSMTATSGPGFSLMQENIGLAHITETPCVVVNVQRGGPSTGLPTLVGQADVMQARWGSHGDYEAIAVAPSSPQECFDFMIKCFNLAQTWRMPVIFLMDEVVGHMAERVVIPEASEIKLVERRRPTKSPEEFLLYEYGEDLVPLAMPVAGEGYRIHVTGLTHDVRGYPQVTEECQEWLVHRLVNKIRLNADKIVEIEETMVDDADVVLVSYGISARPSAAVVQAARERGIKCGLIRLITIWPFCETRIRELAPRLKGLVTVEINFGQVAFEVERCAAGHCKTRLVGHAGGGISEVEDILKAVEEVAK
ncbi:MAG: 2-oxoacid:acceptor oxidoreductase subunit alpha [Pseudomonadota bacterium]